MRQCATCTQWLNLINAMHVVQMYTNTSQSCVCTYVDVVDLTCTVCSMSEIFSYLAQSNLVNEFLNCFRFLSLTCEAVCFSSEAFSSPACTNTYRYFVYSFEKDMHGSHMGRMLNISFSFQQSLHGTKILSNKLFSSLSKEKKMKDGS